jgi:hypothetical protein
VRAVVDTNVLVSGLQDLLVLDAFAGIPIINAGEAVAMIAAG